MRILLIGKDGQVGWELQRSTAPLGELIALGHKDLDLCNGEAIRNHLQQIRPALIINAAAYTAVDHAEDERNLAFAINGEAPGILAQEALHLNAGLIHYSTDYVFDGRKQSPYCEDDPTGPLNTYGASKLAGEQAIVETGAAAIILRTSWVYGVRGSNFFLAMLRLAASRDEVTVINDQFGAPTWSRSIARATSEVVRQCFHGKHFTKEKGLARMHAFKGIYHMTAQGSTSWFGFAKRIYEETTHKTRVIPITTSEYRTRTKRPNNSVLSGEKLKSTFSLSLPSWEEGLKQVAEEYRTTSQAIQ